MSIRKLIGKFVIVAVMILSAVNIMTAETNLPECVFENDYDYFDTSHIRCVFFKSEKPKKYDKIVCDDKDGIDLYQNLFNNMNKDIKVFMTNTDIDATLGYYSVSVLRSDIQTIREIEYEVRDSYPVDETAQKRIIKALTATDKLEVWQKEYIKNLIEDAKTMAKSRDFYLNLLIENGKCKMIDF